MSQNVLCMPARSTIITGQYPRTHGVYANGVPLPRDTPTIAGHLLNQGALLALPFRSWPNWLGDLRESLASRLRDSPGISGEQVEGLIKKQVSASGRLFPYADQGPSELFKKMDSL
jgi:hypothetical protein